MRNSSVKELLALGDKAELLVVGDQARLCLDDQVARPALGELDARSRDLRAQACAASGRGDDETAKLGTRCGGKDAGAALQHRTVLREQVQRVRVRVLLVEFPIRAVLLGDEDVDAELE